jgi:hypothetical protein
MRRAGAGVEQSEIVVNLRDRPDGGPGVVPCGLLFDRNGGRQTLDRIDVRLLHEPEELPGICGERLDVPALAFGVNRVERER